MAHRDAAPTFYVRLLQALRARRLPFLIGGAYGFALYTGIRRPTKDLDLFIRQRDWARLAKAAADAGYRAEMAFPHWLGKVRGRGGCFADVIFNSGNGLSPVDDSWFDGAPPAQVHGVPVRLVRIEESIWTKAFIMERERYDGADVAHLIHAGATRIDWARLLHRFGPHWRVLLAHLVLFGFVYPGERTRVPRRVMEELLERLRIEVVTAPPGDARCAGTLLSREQYLPDVTDKGYEDARLAAGTMTTQDVAGWTAAIDEAATTAVDPRPDGPAAADLPPPELPTPAVPGRSRAVRRRAA